MNILNTKPITIILRNNPDGCSVLNHIASDLNAKYRGLTLLRTFLTVSISQRGKRVIRASPYIQI